MKTGLQDPVGDPRDAKGKRGVGRGKGHPGVTQGSTGLALPSPQVPMKPDTPVQHLESLVISNFTV